MADEKMKYEETGYNEDGWQVTYTGEGYGFDAFYDSISNNEFGAKVDVNNMVIDKEYLHVSDGQAIGNIVDKYNTGNFTQDGNIEIPSYAEALAKLTEVHNYLSQAGYFYDVYDGMPAKMEAIQSDMTSLDESIKAMSSDPLNKAGDSYNDDLEIAKNMQFNRYLESIADAYNSSDNRKKIADTISSYYECEETVENADGSTTTTTYEMPEYDYYLIQYGYFNDDGSGWTDYGDQPYRSELEGKKIEPGTSITASNGNRVYVISSDYDEIDYYFGFKEFNGIIDSLFYTKDKLKNKLDSRIQENITACKYTDLKDRESWAIFNG